MYGAGNFFPFSHSYFVLVAHYSFLQHAVGHQLMIDQVQTIWLLFVSNRGGTPWQLAQCGVILQTLQQPLPGAIKDVLLYLHVAYL